MSASDPQPRAGSRRTPAIAILLLVVLDATFNLYFWKIPKLTGRSTDYGYQFLLDARHQMRRKPPGSIRVLGFGSSVAVSFDPDQVQGLLDARRERLAVGRLLIPGIKPSDYRLFFDAERHALQPDIVLVTLNLVDFLNPSFERDVKPQVRDVLPPWRTLVERHAYIPGVSGKLELLLASASNFYHYRKFIRSAVQDHMKFAAEWMRARRPTRAYGYYADGYTQQEFGLPVDGRPDIHLDYYVDPEWIRQRGRVALRFSAGKQLLARRTETVPGWKTIELPRPSARQKMVDVAAGSAWNRRAAGLDADVRLLGVRLRQPPLAQAADGARPPLRYPPAAADQMDDLLRMGDAVGPAFVDRWTQVLNADTDFGERFRAYREAKLGTCRGPFTPTGEYAELERLVANFSEHGTAVIVVNNPESPLLLAQYRDTPYYRAHVQFLRDLAAKYRDVRFYDLDDALPAEDFNDWHHVNYIGTIKLGPRYAEFIEQAVADLKRPGA